MPPKPSVFDHLISQTEEMSDDQRDRIVDGAEDEHFVLHIDDYSSHEELQKAIVGEIMRLFMLGR